MKNKFLYVGIIFFLLVFIKSAFLEGIKVCQICNKPITTGKYYEQDRKYYHAFCFENANKCKLCNQPIIGQYIEEDGNYYHLECYKQSIRCTFCGKIINDKSYTLLDNEQYHTRCVKGANKCIICGKPIKKGEEEKDHPNIHKTCFSTSIKCSICNNVIIGKYEIDLYGRPYCLRHQGFPKCDICNYPSTTFYLSDGRKHCDRCRKDAVLNESEGKKIFFEVKNILNFQFGIVINKDINFYLVDRYKLNEISGTESVFGKFNRYTIISKNIFGTEKKIKDEFNIYILFGLPLDLFKAVSAHELMHAWQALNCHENQSLELKEGSAELVSFLLMKYIDNKVWMEMIKTNTNELYRIGFEKSYRIYNQKGIKGFLEFLKSATKF